MSFFIGHERPMSVLMAIFYTSPEIALVVPRTVNKVAVNRLKEFTPDFLLSELQPLFRILYFVRIQPQNISILVGRKIKIPMNHDEPSLRGGSCHR